MRSGEAHCLRYAPPGLAGERCRSDVARGHLLAGDECHGDAVVGAREGDPLLSPLGDHERGCDGVVLPLDETFDDAVPLVRDEGAAGRDRGADGLGDIDLEALQLAVLDIVEGREGALDGHPDGALILRGAGARQRD